MAHNSGSNDPYGASALAAAALAAGKTSIEIKDGPVKIDLPIFKPKNECNVIKII